VRLESHVVERLALSKPVITIGRTPDNDLVLLGAQVSRRHAEIRIEEQGPLLTDLRSSNGTFLAGTRLLPHQPRLLMDGDIFVIGPYSIAYRSVTAATEREGIARGGEPVHAETSTPAPPIARMLARAGLQPAALKPARQTWPLVPNSHSGTAAYMQYLPEIFHDGDFLNRFLMIFEDLWEPLEQRQDHIEMYFDPRTCPASLLGWLARWVDLRVSPHWPEARVRNLVAEGMQLHQWCGTRYGLTRMIELCSGVTPEIEETSEPFVFRIRLPRDAGIDKDFVEELIRTYKPAHAGYVLDLEP
jgi:phage tail-like protein